MEDVHYYFDESGEKGFVREGFAVEDIGLIAGIALPSRCAPEFKVSVSKILSNLNTRDVKKIHSTELFSDEENVKVRNDLLEYLSKKDEWLLVYEAVYPLGIYQSKKRELEIINKHKPINPRVKISKNQQKTRIYNYLLEGVIIKLDEICKIENSQNLVMVSDHIDQRLHKEAKETLDYLKNKEHRKTVTGFDTVTKKVVSGEILSKVEGLDISVKHIDTIVIDSTESSMTITADIVANTLYRHIKSAIESTDEMLPAVLALWHGDYEHNGEYWQFPTSTSVPKPVQQPHPPLWVAARSPITYDYAIKNNCNIMCWPLTRGFDEAKLYKQRFDESMAKFENARRPHFALMRHAAIYETKASREKAIAAIQNVLGQFENLFRNIGGVTNGFPAQTPLSELVNRDEYNADMLEENLLFGSPDQAIEKLKKYQRLGVDSFIYYASMGLDHDEQIKSLELFCDKVMPVFANPSGQHLKNTG
jgi:hypothetical protein